MRLLESVFDRLRPHFEEGLLGHAKPLFDAINNFFLAPRTRTRVAPHVRDPLDVKRYMSMVILALAPATVAGLYLFGLRVGAVILVSYTVGGMVEVAFACLRKEEINEGFLVTGLIFPLILPPGIPLWMVAVGIAFGVIVGKEIFGGTGRNPFNAALVGRAMLTLAYPSQMAAWMAPKAAWPGRLTEWATVDAATYATPLAEAKKGVFADVGDLFLGSVGGSIGETSAACVLAGGLFLVLIKVANWRIVAGVLGAFAALGAILHAAAPETFGPVGWHMLAGGLLFGAVFMATDPVTSPITNPAKVMYGILIGVLVLLIRNLTGYVEGVTFAILLGNIAAPVLDELVVRVRMRRPAA